MINRSTDHLYLGIRGHVVCIRKHDGQEQWRTKLKGSDLTCVVVEPDAIYAATRGHLYALDARTGDIRWVNELPRLGFGTPIIASANQQSVAVAAIKQAAEQAAAQQSAAHGGT